MELKDLRKSRGLTQEQLAHIVGLKKNTICSYEKKKRKPDLLNAIKISHALNVDLQTIAEIFSFEEK